MVRRASLDGRKISSPSGYFLVHQYLLPYNSYIPVHTLFNLPRNRRTEPQFCTVCHYLTVLPPPTITHTEAFEAVLSLSLYAPVVATCYSCVPYAPWSSQLSSDSRDGGCTYLTHLSEFMPSGGRGIQYCL